MPADRSEYEARMQEATSEAAAGGGAPLASLAGSLDSEAPHSAAEWKRRRRQGFTVVLPSGMKVHCRRTFDLLARLKDGKIPNPLGAMVQEMIESGAPGLEPSKMGHESVRQMIAMFDQTLEAMLIVPKFQSRPADAGWDWEPDEDAIGPADMPLEDKVFLFQLAQGGTADLATFRVESAHLVESISDGSALSSEA